ncbi:MAG: ATP synthase F1 subunit epsilon [Candidatus Binatus sp.]|uniref:ATP synthase F1 subunit epsilon n=1 Tax=Candidatus Binatus sp. TaxID=2811406 RepID=UPI003C74278E
MAGTFSFTLVTPTGVVAEGQAEEVSAIGPLGEFGVLPDHINFITSLVPGVLEARLPDGVAMHWVVSGGLAEVKDGVMTVLASSAESPDSIDANTAAAQVRQADEIFSSLSFYDPEYAPAQEALMLARARVEAAALKPTPR